MVTRVYISKWEVVVVVVVGQGTRRVGQDRAVAVAVTRMGTGMRGGAVVALDHGNKGATEAKCEILKLKLKAKAISTVLI